MRALPMLKVDGQETMNWGYLVFALVVLKSGAVGRPGRHRLGAQSGTGPGRQSRGDVIPWTLLLSTKLASPKESKIHCHCAFALFSAMVTRLIVFSQWSQTKDM